MSATTDMSRLLVLLDVGVIDLKSGRANLGATRDGAECLAGVRGQLPVHTLKFVVLIFAHDDLVIG